MSFIQLINSFSLILSLSLSLSLSIPSTFRHSTFLSSIFIQSAFLSSIYFLSTFILSTFSAVVLSIFFFLPIDGTPFRPSDTDTALANEDRLTNILRRLKKEIHIRRRILNCPFSWFHANRSLWFA